MNATENGVNRGKPAAETATVRPSAGESKTRPRRLVLLAADEQSAIERVLREYTGAEGPGKGIHADIERLAAQHPGKCVAAEWLGPLGWTRFLWCRKER